MHFSGAYETGNSCQDGEPADTSEVIDADTPDDNDWEVLPSFVAGAWRRRGKYVTKAEIESLGLQWKREAITMQLFVKTLSGKTVVVIVKTTDKIFNVKMKIQNRVGIPPSHQCLTYQGKQLTDEKMIADYNMSKNDTIHLGGRLLGGSFEDPWGETPEVPVFVKTIQGGQGRVISVHVPEGSYVGDLKEKIKARENIETDRFDLVHLGYVMRDDECLDDYGVEGHNSIFVHMRIKENENEASAEEGNSMQIFIRALTGRVVTLQMKENDTVYKMMESIQDKLGMPIYLQRLTFEGHQLDALKLLSDYNIINESTVTLTARLRAAMTTRTRSCTMTRGRMFTVESTQ